MNLPPSIKNHPDYKLFQKKRCLRLLFIIFVGVLGFYLRRIPIRDIQILSDVIFNGSIFLFFIFFIKVFKKPTIDEGIIQSIEDFKSIWLSPPEGHRFSILIKTEEDFSQSVFAECFHGRVTGTELSYTESQPVYILQLPEGGNYILPKEHL